jgi:hypothetical protein
MKPFKYSMMSGQFVLSVKSTGTSTNSVSTNLRSIRMLPLNMQFDSLYDIVIAQIGGTEGSREILGLLAFIAIGSHFVTGSR